MRLHLALFLAAPLALAACVDPFAELTSKTPEAVAEQAPRPQDARPPEVSPLDQPIEVAVGEQAATADGVTNVVTAFVAHGTEPGWTVSVAGKTATYERIDARARKVTVNRLAYAKGVEYIGVLNDRPFVLNIRGTECADLSSGEKHEFTATLTVSGHDYKGCASRAEQVTAEAKDSDDSAS